MSLSSAIDRAVKAYADHTDAVISGDHTLDVSGLLNPFNQIAQFTQQFNPAFFPYASTNGHAPLAPMESAPATGKKKRAYKQRDVNAPKRPLTAYFRFLKEQRPIISSEIAESPGAEGGKAGDISKIATERWKALTDAERAPYKQAYQHELEQYEVDTKNYKDGLAAGTAVKLGAEDADGEDEDLDMDTPSAGPAHVVAKADDSDDEDSDESTSSEDDSDDDSDDEPAPVKAPSPPKKAVKAAKKTVTAAADPTPSQQMFSSLNPTGAPASGQKRKAEDEEGSKKKRGRPTKAEQDAAAAASQLVADEPDAKKEKKEKKKKRKSEAA